jgi:hypothetical protein
MVFITIDRNGVEHLHERYIFALQAVTLRGHKYAGRRTI